MKIYRKVLFHFENSDENEKIIGEVEWTYAEYPAIVSVTREKDNVVSKVQGGCSWLLNCLGLATACENVAPEEDSGSWYYEVHYLDDSYIEATMISGNTNELSIDRQNDSLKSVRNLFLFANRVIEESQYIHAIE